MRRLPVVLALALLAGPWGATARAGAWTSYMHVYSYPGLLAAGDTVWCSTREGGLLRFDVPGQRFDSFAREPGGLASNQLTALARDRTGRLWAGTLGSGVSRYDPGLKRWDLLSRFDGLPSDTVTVLEARGDTVVVGTTGGIALWDGNTIAGAIPDGVNPSPFGSNTITGLALIGDSVWVATTAGIYVSRLSATPLTWSSVNQGLFSPHPRWLASEGHEVFTVVNLVPYVFDFGRNTWCFAGFRDAIGPVSRMSDNNGVVVISATTGIYRWDPTLPLPPGGCLGDWRPVKSGLGYGSSPYPDVADSLRNIFSATIDPASGFTYAARGDGLRTIGSDTTQVTLTVPGGPPGNDIINLALQETSLGPKLWVNTFQEGVGRFDGTAWRNWYPGPGPCGGCDTTFVNPIYTFGIQIDDAGKKWVACWNGPIEEIDDSAWPAPPAFTHHYEAANSELIPAPVRHFFGWSSAIDADGGLWFGLESNGNTNPVTALGLDYYDKSGAFVRNFRPENSNPAAPMRGSQIRGLVVDHDRRVWVGYTGQGLQYFDWPLPTDGSAPLFNTVSGSDNFYVQNLRTFGDSLWVLTASELRRYSARTALPDESNVFTPPSETAQNAVRPLEVGPDGSVWLGMENGLRIYHPGGAVEDFRSSNSPLVNDAIRAIVVEPKTGVAWIGTAGGLSRYDPHYVPVQLAPEAVLHVRVFPNPMTLTAIGTPLRMSGNGGAYSGEVYDLNGRRVRRFSDIPDGQVFWNGLDDHGNVVKPGVYFVRAVSQGRTATARIALVR